MLEIHLHVEFVDFLEEILDAIFVFASMQQHEFDISSGQKARNLLVINLALTKKWE